MPNLFAQPLNYLLLVFVLFSASCSKNEPPETSKFSIEDNTNLGVVIQHEISNNSDISILSPKRYPQAYQFIEIRLAEIFNTNEITYTDQYNWSVTIIDNDSIANSFILPGGIIYITSGLLKNYIETTGEFVSILAHEIVYADRGFVLELLETKYSPSSLLDISLGNNPVAAAEIAEFLMVTPYSEESIIEADRKTCKILCASDYNADAYPNFLERLFPDVLIAWTITHPDNGFRITNVKSSLEQPECDGTATAASEYENFTSLLP